MGSGLILLVIVGAWLAVLVPMALRSHDASSALGTVDKFHDAMRVLSRRQGADKDAASAQEQSGEASPVRSRRPAASPAARRLRGLIGSVVAVVATLVAALLGPAWLWAVQAAADVGLVGYVVWLRHQAVRRAEAEWRDAMAARRRAAPRKAAPTATLAPAPAPAPAVLVVPRHVAGIPSRMPSREVLLGTPVPVPVAQAPARGAQGAPWQPVPVPVPTYVNAPTAPRRVLDLTSSAAYAETLAEAERSLGIDDQGPELDDILERRRAVGD